MASHAALRIDVEDAMKPEWNDLQEKIWIKIAGRFREFTSDNRHDMFVKCFELYASKGAQFVPKGNFGSDLLLRHIAENLVRRAYRISKREHLAEKTFQDFRKSNLEWRHHEMEATSCANSGRATLEQLEALSAILQDSRLSDDHRINWAIHTVREDFGKSPDRPKPGEPAYRAAVEQFSRPIGADPEQVESILIRNGPFAPPHERTAWHRTLRLLFEISRAAAAMFLAAAIVNASLVPQNRSNPRASQHSRWTSADSRAIHGDMAINIQHGSESLVRSGASLAINIQHGADRDAEPSAASNSDHCLT